MSASPASSISPRSNSPDVFDRLAQCQSLLTVRELAQILAISPKTVYNYVSRNMIPHFKIEANVRFRGRDIADWLKRRAA